MNKIRFVQYSVIRCCAYFSHSSEKVHKKHSQNTSNKLQNTRKTPQILFFRKKIRKTPQITNKHTPAKHPQNAKHRKTPQNTFANKTDRIS